MNEDIRERPVETGLFYCNSRYYSPELCRWISPDSVDYLDPKSINGLNLYCYCMNNPIMYVDPTGHSAILSLLLGIAGLIISDPITSVAIAGSMLASMPNSDGMLTQVSISVTSYIVMSIGAIFDKSIRADMNAIGWNPFNSDPSIVANLNKVSFYKGVPVFKISNLGGSMSFGAIFFDVSMGVDVLKHERGHNTQLMCMGLSNYLLQICIPSLWKNSDYNPWELSASILGDSLLAGGASQKQKNIAYLYFIVACHPTINIINILHYIFGY